MLARDRIERPDPEGVRIIGADEAERALERDDVARRRSPEDPRPGDRPTRPPDDAPEPVLRQRDQQEQGKSQNNNKAKAQAK